MVCLAIGTHDAVLDAAKPEQGGDAPMGLYDLVMDSTFPHDFSWGVATSAYQIEGGRYEGGKGESIWDRFADDGRMAQSGDVACDHFHRWREDIALMKDLGVRAYRFSIAWTRILPDGVGPVNEEGVAFYREVIDALFEAGITPWPTLYHWDLPQALQDRGGWANRETVDAFAAYADATSATLGDLVTSWITHNEPWVATFVGHVDGRFAPGLQDWGVGLRVAHHILLSPGRAVGTSKAHRSGLRSIAGPRTQRPTMPPTKQRLATSTGSATAGFSTRCSPRGTRPT